MLGERRTMAPDVRNRVYPFAGVSLTRADVEWLLATHKDGCGFFPEQFRPGDPQSAIAAIAAVIGLLIEICFIVTFTQRFLGGK